MRRVAMHERNIMRVGECLTLLDPIAEDQCATAALADQAFDIACLGGLIGHSRHSDSRSAQHSGCNHLGPTDRHWESTERDDQVLTIVLTPGCAGQTKPVFRFYEG